MNGNRLTSHTKRIVFTLCVILTFGCGRKYPIPPESQYGMPPEESYVLVEEWPGDNPYELHDIMDVIVGKDGFIYVLTPNDLYKLFENGQLDKILVTGLRNATAVDQDILRHICVVDGDIIKVFDRTGRLLYSFEDTNLVTPSGIASDGETIFISDMYRNLVLSYDSTGTLLDTVASYGAGILNVAAPHDLCIWCDRIFVVSTAHNWVEAITIDTPRVNLLHLGGTTHDGDTLPGYFINPVDVAVDDSGYVYVADAGNSRIQKFDRYGNFVIEVKLTDTPISVACSHDGKTLYVGFNNKIEKYRRPERPSQPQ